MTATISLRVIVASVTFDLGWKHNTLHKPLAAFIWNRGCSDLGGDGALSIKAGKSLSKTKVDS